MRFDVAHYHEVLVRDDDLALPDGRDPLVTAFIGLPIFWVVEDLEHRAVCPVWLFNPVVRISIRKFVNMLLYL